MSAKYHISKKCKCGVSEGDRTDENHRNCLFTDNGFLVRGMCILCWSPVNDEETASLLSKDSSYDGQHTESVWSNYGFYKTQRRIARSPKVLYPLFKEETKFKRVLNTIEKISRYGCSRPTLLQKYYWYNPILLSIKMCRWKSEWGQKNLDIKPNYMLILIELWNGGEGWTRWDGEIKRIISRKNEINMLNNREAQKWYEYGALYDVCIEKDTRKEVSLCDDVLSVVRSYVLEVV